MTEKSLNQRNYEEALAFRLSMRDAINKMHDYFSDCNEPGDLKRICYDKLKEFNHSWSDVVLYYLTEWEVEDGLIKSYHPASKISQALENANKKLMARLESLEKEIATLKEGK